MKGSKEEVIIWQNMGFKYIDIKILPQFLLLLQVQL